jgi:hypothetical protein
MLWRIKGHGDLVSCDRFFIAKRLRRSAVTTFERLEYVKYFRPELFHIKLNKVLHDFGFTMKPDIRINSLQVGLMDFWICQPK